MARYGYRCRECGAYRYSLRRDDNQPCPCGSVSRRDWSFSYSNTFQPHFNHTVGKHVNTMQEFKDALARGSDAASERTGMEHSYQPLMPGDIKTGLEPKTDTQALEKAAKINRDKNGFGVPKRSHYAL